MPAGVRCAGANPAGASEPRQDLLAIEWCDAAEQQLEQPVAGSGLKASTGSGRLSGLQLIQELVTHSLEPPEADSGGLSDFTALFEDLSGCIREEIDHWLPAFQRSCAYAQLLTKQVGAAQRLEC